MLMMGITHAVPTTRARVRGGPAHAKALPASASAAAASPVKHLIVEANGVFGHPGNWSVINRYLYEHLDMDHYLIHASKVNQKKDVRSKGAVMVLLSSAAYPGPAQTGMARRPSMELTLVASV